MVRGALRCPDAAAGFGLASDRGASRHADRGTHGFGQDARGVPLGDRRARPKRTGSLPRRRDPRRLRVAAEGARQRHREEPRRPARGDARARTRHGLGAPRDPARRSLGRYAARRPSSDGKAAAAHPHHHSRIAVHSAHFRERSEDARDRAHGDRRRDPRDRGRQARRSSRVVARTPRRARRPPAPAHRPVCDPEADR
jgi:hypothetical protein